MNDVRIVEVGPRDGLQNEPRIISIEDKCTLINLLAQSGLQDIEFGSFVSKQWVPQMADSDEVYRRVQKHENVNYWALTPNLKGLESAIACGTQSVAVFTAASESFVQKNINCSIEESIQRFIPVIDKAKEKGLAIRGYVSCVMGCPYEGAISTQTVINTTEQLFQLGCDEISLGDTIGTGNPRAVKHLIQSLSQVVPIDKLAVHFHDTYGMALVNVYAALEQGVRTIDSAIAGLGGCPYAPGASGNVATEDIVYLVNQLGMNCGVNMNALLEATRFAAKIVDKTPQSKAAQAMMSKTRGQNHE